MRDLAATDPVNRPNWNEPTVPSAERVMPEKADVIRESMPDPVFTVVEPMDGYTHEVS